MKTLKNIFLVIVGLVVLSSCEKILTFEPQGDGIILEEEALQTKEDLQQLLNSVYDVEANFLGGQNQNFSELLADNLSLPNNNDDYQQVWRHGSNFFNGTVSNVYADAYRAIYRSNVVIKDMDRIEMSEEERQRFEGEALFIRALNHFVIVRQFAQPYGYSATNNHLGIGVKTEPTFDPVYRESVNDVYAQIVTDLLSAEAKLPENNGIYADPFAAKALLAKVYLEMSDWQNAYDYANEVIASNRYTLEDSLDRFSPGTSTEAIFEVVSTNSVDERGLGFKNNYRSDGANASPTLRASKELYNLATADTNDLRGQQWYRVIGKDTPDEFIGVAKFDFSYINVPVLHLTEMKLIRAEALGELNTNLSQGEADINDIRMRAGVAPLSIVSSSQLKDAAHAERRLEMVFEGDRVHQLKRQAVNGDVTEIRDSPWDCAGMVIQFPNSEGTVQGFIFNPEGGCN
jgi:hypothetical protein